MKTNEELCDKAGIKFLRRHRKMSLLLIGWIAVAAIVALSVFLWVVADAQATGLVPVALGQWTVGYFFTFIITLILLELVFVGSWVILIIAIIYQQWYKKLPDKEREEYEGRRRHHKESGGFSFFVWLIWFILVWVNGMWNLAFQSWTFNDWVYTWVAACLWALLIVGIPGIMFLIWALRRKS